MVLFPTPPPPPPQVRGTKVIQSLQGPHLTCFMKPLLKLVINKLKVKFFLRQNYINCSSDLNGQKCQKLSKPNIVIDPKILLLKNLHVFFNECLVDSGSNFQLGQIELVGENQSQFPLNTVHSSIESNQIIYLIPLPIHGIATPCSGMVGPQS